MGISDFSYDLYDESILDTAGDTVRIGTQGDGEIDIEFEDGQSLMAFDADGLRDLIALLEGALVAPAVALEPAPALPLFSDTVVDTDGGMITIRLDAPGEDIKLSHTEYFAEVGFNTAQARRFGKALLRAANLAGVIHVDAPGEDIKVSHGEYFAELGFNAAQARQFGNALLLVLRAANLADVIHVGDTVRVLRDNASGAPVTEGDRFVVDQVTSAAPAATGYGYRVIDPLNPATRWYFGDEDIEKVEE
jgi:hypothetical protein